MKKYLKLFAVVMTFVLAMSLLTGCGKSMKKIEEIMDSYDEEDYYTYDCVPSSIEYTKETCQDAADKFFKGEIVEVFKIKENTKDDDKEICVIIEFEKSGDAKNFYKGVLEHIAEYDEKDIDDEEDKETLFDIEFDDIIMKRSGKIVLVSNSDDLIEELW